MTTLQTVLAYILILPQIIIPAFTGWLIPVKDFMYENWNSEKEFKRSYAFEVEKDPDKDFVILNLTDIQLNVREMQSEYGEMAKAIVDRLVEETNPDYITVTGDNGSGCYTYITLAKWLDSYGIPWSLVMGNHDGQGTPNELWCARSLVTSKNCLFKLGPKGMGHGNYIVNITENGKIIHSMFMMDTHSGAAEDSINKLEGTDGGYDHLWQPQLDWYKWAVNGISEVNGGVVESTVFMHIPVYQYRLAWNSHYDKENECFKPEYADTDFGVNNEWICSAEKDNGFFDLCKELGSTKNMVVGHDHVNCSSILYDGIRLSYGVKTGAGCYWEPQMSGGTTITIGSDGHAKIEHHIIDASEYLNK